MNRAVSCAALAAILLAACGGGGSAKKTAALSATTTSPASTTTTVAGSTTTAAGGTSGATATTKAGAAATPTGGATVNGKPASSYTPPAGATPAKPATPGTYTYDNQGKGPFGPPPAKSSLIIDPPQGTQQGSTNDMGSSGKTEETLDYRPEGVHVVEVKLTAGPQTYDFVGNPPPLAAPTGVQPGQSVDFTLSDPKTNTTIQVHIDFVRMETITIGGQAVNTMVIHQVGTLSGSLKGTQTSDSWVSPQYDLFVKTHATANVQQGAFAVQSDVTSTLEKLTPG